MRQVHIDPHRPEKTWLATADGLMVSDDDGENFERAGGLLFVGANVRCLSAGEVPGHMIAVTDTEVWETRERALCGGGSVSSPSPLALGAVDGSE